MFSQQVSNARKQYAAAGVVRKEFLGEWQALWRSSVKKPAVTNPKDKKSLFYTSQGGSVRVFPLHVVTTAEAKMLLPPSSTIFQASRGFWESQLCAPPHPRCAKSWGSMTGESHLSACRFVVRDAWRKFLRYNCLPLSACPVSGLFDGGHVDPSCAACPAAK